MHLPKQTRAVITGAGSGLGRAFAVTLAKRGARILITDVNEAGCEVTAEEVRRAGGEAIVLRCDVTKPEDLEAAAIAAEHHWGGADLLINNAGIATAGFVGDLSLELWERTLAVNLRGVIHGCHAFIPRFKKQYGGFLLNVASSAGIASLPEMGPYNVSKAGVISLSETLYAELSPYGISVTALCPTFFPTGLFDTMQASSERQRRMAHALFANATMDAKQVASAALRGLESGQLIVIPQLDGALLWRIKRLLPGAFHGVLRLQQRYDLVAKFLGVNRPLFFYAYPLLIHLKNLHRPTVVMR